MTNTKSTFGDRLGFYFFAWITIYIAAVTGSALEFQILEEGFVALFINLFSNLVITSIVFVALVIAIELLFT